MTKKTDKKEPTVTDDIKAEAQVEAEAPVESAEAIVTEAATNAAQEETYTLTAEEFAAAKAHIEALTKEKDETINLLQRIQADFDNFRRRNNSVRLDSYEEGKRDSVKELLPALDNLERALLSIPEDSASWREGILLVQRQLLDSLKKLGVEEVEAAGQFDPSKHEAVMREKVEGTPSGKILAVFQKGYRMGDRVIRHCIVKVAE